MSGQDAGVVRVHREWNAWRTAEVSIGDLEQVHWLQPPGAPHEMLHAYVSSARLGDSTSAAEGTVATTSGRVRVCVLKRHVTPSVYAEIVRRVGSAAPAFSQRVRT